VKKLSLNKSLIHQVLLHVTSSSSQSKGSHFESTEDISRATPAVPNNLQENDFMKFFDSWKQHWNSCTAAGRNYSEGDHCISA
jgi:hypothetical protein